MLDLEDAIFPRAGVRIRGLQVGNDELEGRMV